MAHDVLSNMETGCDMCFRVHVCVSSSLISKIPTLLIRSGQDEGQEYVSIWNARTINIGQCVFPSGSLDKIRRCRSQMKFLLRMLVDTRVSKEFEKNTSDACESTHVGCGNELDLERGFSGSTITQAKLEGIEEEEEEEETKDSNDNDEEEETKDSNDNEEKEENFRDEKFVQTSLIELKSFAQVRTKLKMMRVV